MVYICCLIISFALACIAGRCILNRNPNRNPDKKQILKLTEWDRNLMAFHEAGHAVCSFYLPEREPLVKITIDPSSDAFGMIKTETRPHHNETQISLTSAISTYLAGRIAEELFCNEITTSCIHDLNAAQTIASEMVIQFGMGRKTKFAILPNDSQPIGRQTDQIMEDIQSILQDAEKTVRTILTEHSEEVIALAHILLSKNTLDTSEIDDFFRQSRG